MPPKVRRDRLDGLLNAPWALFPQTLRRIAEWGRGVSDIDAAMMAPPTAPHEAQPTSSIAIVPVYGVIEHHSDWMMEMFGGCSIDGIRETLQAALNDPSVSSIILDIDSPGGTVAGMTELANEIMAARGGAKPIVAVADSFAASAAYWLAAACDEIVASPSAQVGSIGVYAIHQDISKMLEDMGVTTTLVSAGPHKTEGNEFEPLTDEAKQAIQDRVNASYDQFVGDVAAGRGVSVADVKADFGGGRVFTARDAKAAGMVDRVETLGETMQRLMKPYRRKMMGATALTVNVTAQPPVIFQTATGPVTTSASTGGVPFADRLAALAAEADALVEHATERARLRAKEGRPAFSTTTEQSLRAIREAVDVLLDPVDPDEPEPAVDPPPVAVKPVAPAPAARRFQSEEEWLAYLTQN